jgi:hypothetical protein
MAERMSCVFIPVMYQSVRQSRQRCCTRQSGSNGTENSLKESGKLLDRFGRAAEGT